MRRAAMTHKYVLGVQKHSMRRAANTEACDSRVQCLRLCRHNCDNNILLEVSCNWALAAASASAAAAAAAIYSGGGCAGGVGTVLLPLPCEIAWPTSSAAACKLQRCTRPFESKLGSRLRSTACAEANSVGLHTERTTLRLGSRLRSTAWCHSCYAMLSNVSNIKSNAASRQLQKNTRTHTHTRTQPGSTHWLFG